MSSEEKAAVLHAFKAGSTRLLVASTVVEVGVDVKEASVMVVEHADR
jgi:ATP-dependent DNA helicase RecG